MGLVQAYQVSESLSIIKCTGKQFEGPGAGDLAFIHQVLLRILGSWLGTTNTPLKSRPLVVLMPVSACLIKEEMSEL